MHAVHVLNAPRPRGRPGPAPGMASRSGSRSMQQWARGQSEGVSATVKTHATNVRSARGSGEGDRQRNRNGAEDSDATARPISNVVKQLSRNQRNCNGMTPRRTDIDGNLAKGPRTVKTHMGLRRRAREWACNTYAVRLGAEIRPSLEKSRRPVYLRSAAA